MLGIFHLRCHLRLLPVLGEDHMTLVDRRYHHHGPALTRRMLQHHLSSVCKGILDLILHLGPHVLHLFIEHGGELFLAGHIGTVSDLHFAGGGHPESLLEQADEEVLRTDGIFKRRHVELITKKGFVKGRPIGDVLESVLDWNEVGRGAELRLLLGTELHDQLLRL